MDPDHLMLRTRFPRSVVRDSMLGQSVIDRADSSAGIDINLNRKFWEVEYIFKNKAGFAVSLAFLFGIMTHCFMTHLISLIRPINNMKEKMLAKRWA